MSTCCWHNCKVQWPKCHLGLTKFQLGLKFGEMKKRRKRETLFLDDDYSELETLRCSSSIILQLKSSQTDWESEDKRHKLKYIPRIYWISFLKKGIGMMERRTFYSIQSDSSTLIYRSSCYWSWWTRLKWSFGEKKDTYINSILWVGWDKMLSNDSSSS